MNFIVKEVVEYIETSNKPLAQQNRMMRSCIQSFCVRVGIYHQRKILELINSLLDAKFLFPISANIAQGYQQSNVKFPVFEFVADFRSAKFFCNKYKKIKKSSFRLIKSGVSDGTGLYLPKK